MKVVTVAVGRPRGPVAAAIAEYEKRAARYFSFEAVEVKEEAFRKAGDAARMKGRCVQFARIDESIMFQIC